MKLQCNAVTLPLFSNLHNFRQIYCILMRFFWTPVPCIFATLVL